MRIGVAEFGQVAQDEVPVETIRATVERAKIYERLGLFRLWLGEHHRPANAWGAPDPLVAAIAARTDRLRVGTGCILLHYRDPYRVASDFRLLASLHPGRIELGVGSGVVGADASAALGAEDSERSREEYEEKAEALVGYLRAGSRTKRPFRGVHPAPVGSPLPGLWMMGSSRRSAELAGRLGANFCYALFTPTSERDPAVVRAFREEAVRPREQVHAVGLAAGWYDDASELDRAPEPGDYPAFGRVSFSGSTARFAEWLERTWQRYGEPELLILNRSLRADPRPAAWRSLVETVSPEATRDGGCGEALDLGETTEVSAEAGRGRG